MDVGLLADTILAIMMETREPAERAELLRELDETPAQKRDREKRERRSILMAEQTGG